jgi:D-3-phosphoglycerate dehydrogenase
MEKYKVLNSVNYEGCRSSLNKLEEIADVINIPSDRQQIKQLIGSCHAYITTLDVRFDKELIDLAVNLKVLVTPSTGTDHIDMEYLKAKNILCFDLSKEYELINGFSATSELAFTLLLTLNRKLINATNSIFLGKWGREEFTGLQLLGKTFGIIGLGRLGRISARIANGFGMNVIAHDILEKNEENVEMVSLQDIFIKSDFISIHVHLNESTRGMINNSLFDLAKSTCILINTSRGAIVSEDDLLNALINGKISAAGLDMIDGEWMQDKINHKLVKYSRENENLLITPHIGGATKESIYGARIFMAEKLYNFLYNLRENL